MPQKCLVLVGGNTPDGFPGKTKIPLGEPAVPPGREPSLIDVRGNVALFLPCCTRDRYLDAPWRRLETCYPSDGTFLRLDSSRT